MKIESTASKDSTDVEHVVVTIRDTIKEVTTIVVQTNQAGDTLRVAQVTDRTRASNRDHVREVQQKLIVKADTVYIEKQSDHQNLVAADPNVEIDKEGNVTRRVNRISQTLKWVFFVLAALAVLLIVLKFYKH
ncbi:MAG: hypothetical protein CW341_06360 [Bacteroidetes bacterium]|nr:hypothetical protein [Bacteroidota bacterium]